MNFQNVYWDWNSMQNNAHSASILAIGDSWFWYPFPGGSLINRLGPLVAPKEHFILAIGNNGAEAFDYVHGKYKNIVTTTLNFHGPGLSAVFISGGGNDFAGVNDLLPLLNPDCKTAKSAAECFKPGDADGTLGGLMKKTAESYTLLIGQIMVKCPSDIKIFLHNYDYAIPSGEGLFGNDSDWLKPALEDAFVPEGLQRDCTKFLIDRLSDVLTALRDQGNGQVVFVDSRNTLTDSDWANELHPTPGGFKKIAENKWAPALAQNGLVESSIA
jgi:hypothetical protein